MSKHKNPFTKGTVPYNIWQDGYLSGKLDGLNEIDEFLPSEEEIKEQMENALELMIAKDKNKIM